MRHHAYLSLASIAVLAAFAACSASTDSSGNDNNGGSGNGGSGNGGSGNGGSGNGGSGNGGSGNGGSGNGGSGNGGSGNGGSGNGGSGNGGSGNGGSGNTADGGGGDNTPDGGGGGSSGGTPTTAGPNWSWFGRDYNNTRTNIDETKISASNVTGLKKKWGWAGKDVTSTPAVVDGTVYFADWGGNLVALKASDGSQVWKTSLQSGMLSGSPFVSADTVYIAGDGSMVYAVNRTSGAKIWGKGVEATMSSRIWSSPVVIDSTLIVGVGSYQVFYPPSSGQAAFRGSVVGLDPSNGTEKWRAWVCDSGKSGVSVWSSAAIDKDAKLAFIGTGQAYTKPVTPMSDSLVAINYDNGTIKWSHQFTAGDAYQINSTTGQTLQNGPDNDVGASPNLFEAGGKKLVGVGDKAGNYYALDRSSGTVVWSRALTAGSPLGGVEETTAYSDGIIYAVSNIGIDATSRADAKPAQSKAFAINATDGSIKWQTAIPKGGFGGVAIANGLMYFTTYEGTLHVLATSDGHELFTIKVGSAAAGGATISDGLVFVGNGWTWTTADAGGLTAFGL